MRGVKNTRVYLRLAVLGLGLRDLQEAINERMYVRGKKPVNYTMLSRLMNGGATHRPEVIDYANAITSTWMIEYAAEWLRVLTPRLEDSGVRTYDLLAKVRIDAEESPTVHFRDYHTGHTAAVYNIMTDELFLQGG